MCIEAARAITQSLVNRLFDLPSEGIKGGRMAELPPGTTRLPREKPVPKPKPLTKWQKFAQKKGIVKRKRSKLVFDETSQDWKRRHGYKKANDPDAIPILEAKPGDKVRTEGRVVPHPRGHGDAVLPSRRVPMHATSHRLRCGRVTVLTRAPLHSTLHAQPGEDPFAALEAGRKERVKKNKKAQLENAKEAARSGALPATLKLAATLASHGSGSNSKAAGPRAVPKGKRKELKDEVRDGRGGRGSAGGLRTLLARANAPLVYPGVRGAQIQFASRLSGISTASLGKFDKRLEGEKANERAPLGKRRHFLSVTDTATERNKVRA